MAVSPAYVMGALDALARNGAVSTSYADGVRSVLEKKALWPVALAIPGGAVSAAWYYPYKWYSNSQRGARFNESLRDANAARGGTDAAPQITTEDAMDALHASRPLHDNAFGRMWEGAKSIVRPFKSAIPGNPKTWDQYQIDHENWQRADEQDYMRRANIEGIAGGPLGQRAMALIHGHHSDVANDYATGAKEWMPQSQREAEGLPEKPVNMYQTPYTQSGLDGGLYKLPNDYGNKPADPPKGYGGPSEYGDNASLFRSDSASIQPRRQ